MPKKNVESKDDESQYDNCYMCNLSLVENYDKGVGIIKDKNGAHFVCYDCSEKVRKQSHKK